MQHPTPHRPGEDRDLGDVCRIRGKQSKFELPVEYTNVKITFLDPKKGKCPNSAVPVLPNSPISNPREKETQWLRCTSSGTTCTTWAEFHSHSDTRKPEDKQYCTRISILPVFYEVAHTMSMMEHCMAVVAQTVQHLNPGQIPVMTVDQPLYALCKSIQWQNQSLGENRFFVMFGGMHIKLAALRVVGQWLEGSGWTNALVGAGIITSGRADSMIKVTHLTRSRYAHQVTAAALNLATKAARESFSKHVTALGTTLITMGNPFLDKTQELYNIHTQKVCSPDVIKFVTEVEQLGPTQYRDFCANRLETCNIPLHDPIREIKIKLFGTPQRPGPTKEKAQIKSLKENCNLWSRLYLATSSHRPTELDKFFSHENSEYPPSLSLNGSLRSTEKSEQVKCLIESTKIETGKCCPEVDVKILDGAAIVHMLKPGVSVNFEQYINNVFVPFIKSECRCHG